jgi:hypothetical protein
VVDAYLVTGSITVSLAHAASKATDANVRAWLERMASDAEACESSEFLEIGPQTHELSRRVSGLTRPPVNATTPGTNRGS